MHDDVMHDDDDGYGRRRFVLCLSVCTALYAILSVLD
jgi:hypothetical protein